MLTATMAVAEAAQRPAPSPPTAPAAPATVPPAMVPPVAPAAPNTSAPATSAPATSAPAATTTGCQNSVPFDIWLEGVKKDAAASGVKAATLQTALTGIAAPEPSVISRDRGQAIFQKTFLDFSASLATAGRYKSGLAQMAKHKDLFARAEQEYGVPPPVIAAFWALESDFGAALISSKQPILRSLTTLAYDCRRGALFRAELIAALKIIDRGDLTPEEMKGSWAGEIGQTQFLPSHYYKYAVDYDGDGKRDLYKSIPDVIGSSAHFVARMGWKRGEPWLREVRVPASMPWQEADLAIRHPAAKWTEFGVTKADGSPLDVDTPPAALLLPMGRNGPAFLAYPNFQVYIKWNSSLIYTTTAAYLATRMAGSPVMRKGNAPVPKPLTIEEMKELQSLLARQGVRITESDGKLGAGTRAAVRQMQTKLGMPPDAWPTMELLEAVRRTAPAAP